MKNTLDSAYLGQNFFWAMGPKENDFVLFEFNSPAPIKKYNFVKVLFEASSTHLKTLNLKVLC
jgi:hypothetical protein